MRYQDWQRVSMYEAGVPACYRLSVPGGWLYVTEISNGVWSQPIFIKDDQITAVPSD